MLSILIFLNVSHVICVVEAFLITAKTLDLSIRMYLTM